MREDIKNKLNETLYWRDENMKEYLNKSLYGNSIVNHLLWRYENFLQNKGYNIQNFSIEMNKLSIFHQNSQIMELLKMDMMLMKIKNMMKSLQLNI